MGDKMSKTLHMIGYASSIAARFSGCEDGPQVLQESVYFKALQAKKNIVWDAMLTPDLTITDKYNAVQKISEALAQETFRLTQAGEKFVMVGGDHSCAIGTWSGARHALQLEGDLGLIWIDAHMDGHTPKSTPSGNIHGMPVATLLGCGDERLTHVAHALAKIKPQHLAMLGMRSYEPKEKALLESLGVKIFYMDEIKKQGFNTVFQKAVDIVSRGTAGFGISIDLDSLDPFDAPGTGMPEPDGIALADLCHSLEAMRHARRCVGLEIAEFDPHASSDDRTLQAICNIIKAWYQVVS